MEDVKKELQKTLKFTNQKPLLAIWNVAPFMLKWSGVKAKDYYLKPEIKMKTQLKVQEYFPETIMFPGIWADFGNSVEMSAFGARIKWFEDDAPYSIPLIYNLEDINRLSLPDPRTDGLMPQALQQYQYFWDNLDRKFIDSYGYLKGVAFSVGPVEIAALLRGYENFYIDMYDSIKSVHQLLKLTTELVINWIKAQEKVNGNLERLFISDHVPSQINKQQFKEFALPYLNWIFNEFSDAVILYHNEGKVSHIIEDIKRLNFNIFHFGDKIETVKTLVNSKICLMGNLNPLYDIVQKDEVEIERQSLNIIKEVGPRGFFLSTGGGMAPDTTIENVQAISRAIKKFKFI